jgi:hypothetical protein
MIQQFHFWVYIQKNVKQGLKEVQMLTHTPSVSISVIQLGEGNGSCLLV